MQTASDTLQRLCDDHAEALAHVDQLERDRDVHRLAALLRAELRARFDTRHASLEGSIAAGKAGNLERVSDAKILAFIARSRAHRGGVWAPRDAAIAATCLLREHGSQLPYKHSTLRKRLIEMGLFGIDPPSATKEAIPR